MAQTFTSTACQTFGTTGFFINPPKYIEEGYIVRAATLSLSFSATVSAVLQMVPIPRGAQLHDVILQWDGLGSASYVLKVGDSGNVARYIVSCSATSSGVCRLGQNIAAGALTTDANGGMGYSYSADATINVKVQATGTTSAQGSVRLTIMYSMDNNQKG